MFVRWAIGNAWEQVRLERAKVFCLSMLATEDTVFKVYDEREIGHAAVIVSMAVEHLIAAAGRDGVLKSLAEPN